MIKKFNVSVFLLSYFLLLLLISTTTTVSAEKRLCHPDDEKALIEVMKGLNNGSVFETWTPETDCCREWYMTNCDVVTHRVYDLLVTYNDLITGPIPDAIGDFPYLTTLEFHKCASLTGTIPRSITRLKRLNYLWLDHNNLTGPIPDFLSELKELKYINLSFNNFTGPIPPSLADLPNLTALFLGRNRLTGSIPSSFGRIKGEQSFYLSLTKNQLSGPIPLSLQAANFTQVYLDRNNFTGDASMFFGKDKGLVNIDISRNQFSFNMTSLELPTGLRTLDLNHNSIYGDLPQALAKLNLLNVSYNRLCGQIPSTISFDQTSFFHNKCLCGSPLPACK